MRVDVNRRGSPRADVGAGRIRASFLGSSYDVRNISASGLLILPYDGASTIGQFLRLMIAIDDCGLNFAFEADARVVRIERDSVAMQFHAISSEGRERLAAYFSRRFSSNLFDVKA